MSELSVTVADDHLTMHVGMDTFRRLIRDVNFRGTCEAGELNDDQREQVSRTLGAFVLAAQTIILGRR